MSRPVQQQTPYGPAVKPPRNGGGCFKGSRFGGECWEYWERRGQLQRRGGQQQWRGGQQQRYLRSPFP